MAADEIEWDEDNRRHIRERRRASERQVEEVLHGECYPNHVYSTQRVRGEHRANIHGRTCRGRFLEVVAQVKDSGRVLRPITCWPLSGDQLEAYRTWLRRKGW